MGGKGERTKEGVNELCGGVHHVGTPKSKMSGIAWVMVEGEGSNDDHPGRIIRGERGSLVGEFSGLCEELDDFWASGVVFGSGFGGHCCQTSQRGLAVSLGVRTGSKRWRRVFLCRGKTLGHVARLCQKLEGGAVDGIITRGRGGITDELWGIQVFGLGGVEGEGWYVLGVVDLHGGGL